MNLILTYKLYYKNVVRFFYAQQQCSNMISHNESIAWDKKRVSCNIRETWFESYLCHSAV